MSRFEDLTLPQEEIFFEAADDDKEKSVLQNASNAVSLCVSVEKKKNEEEEKEDDGDSSDGKKGIIHVATPQCYDSLMSPLNARRKRDKAELSPPSSQSSVSRTDCQLNLTSTFDDIVDGESPMP